jgi:hypothetical protein
MDTQKLVGLSHVKEGKRSLGSSSVARGLPVMFTSLQGMESYDTERYMLETGTTWGEEILRFNISYSLCPVNPKCTWTWVKTVTLKSTLSQPAELLRTFVNEMLGTSGALGLAGFFKPSSSG